MRQRKKRNLSKIDTTIGEHMARGGFNMGGMNRNQMMAQARKMQ